MASDEIKEKRLERLVVDDDSSCEATVPASADENSATEPGQLKARDEQAKPVHNAPAQEQLPPKQGMAWWKLVATLFLACGLMWFAFKDADMEKTIAYASTANPFWLVATFCVGTLSHTIRAFRWMILLEPVAGRKISVWNSFYATMLGYAANLVIPRGGEIVRLALISKMEHIPIAGVAPTMLIDRLIDVVMLALLLGVSLTFLPQKILTEMPYLIPVGVAMLVCAVLGIVLLPKAAVIIKAITAMKLIKDKVPERILEKLIAIADQFEVGAKCLANPKAYPMITALSIGMWGIYALNFYLVILAFNLQNIVSLKDCFLTFSVGSIGVMIPTPGSAGGFHVMVSKVLMWTTGLPNEQALAYATVLHLVTFIAVNSIVAGACLVINYFVKASKAPKS